jgi:diguanylate cyclase (GGDEF)-like protein
MQSFKLKLVFYFFVLSLLPLTAAFWGFSAVAKRSETSRVDARLEAATHAALVFYSDSLAAAEQAARQIADEPAVQEALLRKDRRRLAQLLSRRRQVRLELNGGFRVGRVAPLAAERRALLYLPTGVAADVVASVPLDRSFLRRVRKRSPLSAGEHFVLLRGNKVAVSLRRDLRGTVTGGLEQAATLSLGGVKYRTLATELLPEPEAVRLAVLSPNQRIDRASNTVRAQLLAGLVAALLLVGLIAWLEGRSIVQTLRNFAATAKAIAQGRLGERVDVRGRDEFAQLGQAFNEMADQLAARLDELEAGRRRLRDTIARFAEVLGATHETDQLLRVIVDAVVEAAGASGGYIIGPDGIVAEAGDADGERIELPLQAGRESFGTIVLTGPGFTLEQLESAATLAGQAAIALENARLHAMVKRQAQIDGLTGLANRRHAEEVLRTEIARAERYGSPLALVMADLDGFKAINDVYGHPAGDTVLREFAQTLRHTTREIDVTARWGGEEFALILPNTGLSGAVELAERVRTALMERTILTPDGDSLSVTASFGVAAFSEATGEEELVAAADEALYEAKRSGRNRVVAASAEPAQRP